eukprot:CAMPEP_0172477266 /NCGR_PEP_ID=MMETSP1066-20121228/252_1 /TAXON_ID=671091 /ORGANISM="Coscinodiscus wailesii, Strain CCMP2513" /LENGTH=81 /DNA_ID=CAMNT_0013235593 /DNA_START=125 /DNA_END=371 /DNA_ORIENTATION=+
MTASQQDNKRYDGGDTMHTTTAIGLDTMASWFGDMIDMMMTDTTARQYIDSDTIDTMMIDMTAANNNDGDAKDAYGGNDDV